MSVKGRGLEAASESQALEASLATGWPPALASGEAGHPWRTSERKDVISLVF